MKPPSTVIACPVIKDDLSDNKNDTTSATSLGVPILPIAVSSIRVCISHAVKFSFLIISVSMQPGHTAFTLIPDNPSSFAIASENAITPAFDAE